MQFLTDERRMERKSSKYEAIYVFKRLSIMFLR